MLFLKIIFDILKKSKIKLWMSEAWTWTKQNKHIVWIDEASVFLLSRGWTQQAWLRLCPVAPPAGWTARVRLHQVVWAWCGCNDVCSLQEALTAVCAAKPGALFLSVSVWLFLWRSPTIRLWNQFFWKKSDLARLSLARPGPTCARSDQVLVSAAVVHPNPLTTHAAFVFLQVSH